MEDFQERAAHNEAKFRLINEDIGRGREADDDVTLIGFVCECGHSGCTRLVELTPAEYERLRSDPCLFAVVGGHEIPSVERVAERNDRYTIVEKLAGTGRIAVETDPRR